ncbi:MAG: cyclic dehypoxanthinyl futalosine synthase [Armatimonadota bacterium]
MRTPHLTAVGWLANAVRERMHGSTAYWVRNRHINYTNVCCSRCRFCGFYARQGGPDPYVLSPDDIAKRLANGTPPTEVHIVGGVNPALPYEYYLDILRAAKSACPNAHVKAFTMVELAQIIRVSGKSVQEVLADLKQAGLDSMPGGGAEVFSDRLHRLLFPGKIAADEWLSLARAAHQARIPTNATMLYGHLETDEERVAHLVRLRELQDETGGFLAFVPLAFDPADSDLAHLPRTTGYADLRTIAVARLMLDNFPHIKSFWVMVSPAVAQVCLHYGADDIDGTVVEYEITNVEARGRRQELSVKDLTAMIREAGREPVERDALYRPVQPHHQPGAGGPAALEDIDAGLTVLTGARRASETASNHARVRLAVEKVLSGERLSREDGVTLIFCRDLLLLSSLADFVRWRKHPEPIVTFNIGRNINYTNVCSVRCRFCAFSRSPGDPEGYVLSTEEILRKIEALVNAGGREVLLQGGVHPELGIEYFEELFREIKRRFDVDLHALSATEIRWIARVSGISVEEALRRLRAAGLNTIPGASEMLVDEVRRRVSPLKESADDWVALMRTAHRMGIRTSATMMYGSVETLEQRIEHLLKIRDLQDETGGFTAFIPWPFQPDGTRLPLRKTWAFDYLRTVAVSRLMLDNIDNIQASWVTQGSKIAQVSLRYGVNDFGSTMMEENVVRAAGTSFLIPIEEIRRLIRDAGYEPRLRDTLYRLLD